MTQKKLKKLYFFVNKVISIAQSYKDDFKADPINWADLKVVEIREIKSYSAASFELSHIEKFTKEKYIEVVISEASPNSFGLIAFVEDYLHQNGFNNVRVITEW